MINIFDKVLIAILILLAISFNIILNNVFSSDKDYRSVTVTINKEIYDTYDLTKDNTYTISFENKFNTFSIENGYVKMTDANCRDKLCTSQRKINNNFGTIVCLPHNLIIEVGSDIESEIDSIVQ